MRPLEIVIEGVDPFPLLGHNDAHLRLIEEAFSSRIVLRDGRLIIIGGDQKGAKWVLSECIAHLKENKRLDSNDVQTIIRLSHISPERPGRKAGKSNLELMTPKVVIRPRSKNQLDYFKLVKENDLVFAIGPAGTGKTYLAVAFAVTELEQGGVERIVLARPAVEAGESLGFLPGDFKEKVDPYLRPLYDALFDMIPPERLRRLLGQKIIEVVPLAYMRGRTLNNAFVILDEAQNTSPDQMKMFLTRLGIDSRAIVTGDITQIDLPDKSQSGLVIIQHILAGIDGVQFIYFSRQDVVRHRLVKDIIAAYETFEKLGDEPSEK
ncbi:PhoH family protein [candidate division KSB1 bacterium]|nr:PhoH family protein [candidate division KSB1 bacterium]